MRRVETVEVSILMPCLNEAETIDVCVRKARGYLESHGISGEVVVADNGSTDGSQALATKAGARVVHVPNAGYGAALAGGIQAAHGNISSAKLTTLESMLSTGFLNRNFVLFPISDRQRSSAR